MPLPLRLPSLCHTPSLFLSEIMKDQGMNKIVCCTKTNFNTTLMFSIYSEYTEVKNCFNINVSGNKMFLRKHTNISGKHVLVDVS
jgi:hypothetical protein